MKGCLKSFFRISVLLLAFCSCGKDEVEKKNTPPGSFTIDGGKERPLATGLVFEDAVNDHYRWAVILSSGSVKYVVGTPGAGVFGTGNLIMFTVLILNKNEDELPVGMFEFSESAYHDTANALTNSGAVFVDFDFATHTGEHHDYFSEGEVNVSREGDNHRIIFTLTTVDGSVISGSFKGILEIPIPCEC